MGTLALSAQFWHWIGLKIGALAFAAAASALAIGPDFWIEWILWGSTVISVAGARTLLLALAAAIVIAIAWPALWRPKHGPRG